MISLHLLSCRGRNEKSSPCDALTPKKRKTRFAGKIAEKKRTRNLLFAYVDVHISYNMMHSRDA